MTFYSDNPQLDEARRLVAGASCWVLTDGKAGDEAQCLGVAERLGLEPELRRVSPRPPWVWAMPWGPVDPREAPGRAGSPIAPPFPDICIASGRRAVAYLRRVRRDSDGRTLTVFLKDPSSGADTAETIWVPAHDKLRGPNVLATLTSPHRISPERLQAARTTRQDWVIADRETVGVLLGGNSKNHRFTPANIADLVARLARLAAAGANLVVTPSRRTPPELADAVHEICRQTGGYYWNGSGENPYLAILAHAAHLVVTADSVNMLGEAVATGKPVHLFTPSGGHTKISSFVSGLERYGAVRPLGEHLESWAYEPLDATQDIAIAVAQAFARKVR